MKTQAVLRQAETPEAFPLLHLTCGRLRFPPRGIGIHPALDLDNEGQDARLAGERVGDRGEI